MTLADHLLHAGADFKDIVRVLLRVQPWMQSGVGTSPLLTAGKPGDPELPFQDRDSAVDDIVDAVTQNSVAEGEGRTPIICVHGSQGLGKSTVLQRAAAELIRTGVPCVAITYNFMSKGPDQPDHRRVGIGERLLWR